MKNPIFDSELQLESKLPLHQQLMMIIKKNIASKKIFPGDKLPTEEEFCNAFGVSRSTVRSAIGALEEEGLVVRVRGKGTFLSKSKLQKEIEQSYSFFHEMKSANLDASSKLLEFQMISAGDELAALFGLQPEELIYKFERLRMVEAEPLLLETTFLPVKIHPTLTVEQLENGSLYDSLRDDAGIFPYLAEETYESIILDEKTAKVLNCPGPSCGFLVKRITKQKSGQVYELTQSLMRGDRAKILITLQQGIYTFQRKID